MIFAFIRRTAIIGVLVAAVVALFGVGNAAAQQTAPAGALTAPVTGTFNVASGTPRSVLDMARALTRAVAPDREPVVTGGWRAGDVRHVFASAAAAAERLGFRGAEDFDAGMREFAGASLRA